AWHGSHEATARGRVRPGSRVTGAPDRVTLSPTPNGQQAQREFHMASQGKVAVVTGGGSGIGRASALAFQTAGRHGVIAGRGKEELDKPVAMAKAGGGKMLAVHADVGKPEDVKVLFAETKKAFGRLDFLFNNAGFGAPAVPMEDLTYQQWQSVVDANLTGSFLCAQEAIKIMKAQTPKGGRIVNNGSIPAHTHRPNYEH